jgi:hypothetical protein
MLRWLGWGIAACFRLRASLVVENICLRQQLLVLRRRQPRPRIRDADRRFWVLACRWFADWQRSLLIVKPETVLGWHRRGWRAYWRRRSRWGGKAGRRPIAPELRDLIRRMAAENRLWGQRRIQAELARLGFRVSARTIGKAYASSVGWPAVSALARVPQATRVGNFGLRLPLRADGLLSNALCVLRCWSRQPGSSPRPDDAASDGRMGKPADHRVLWLGSGATVLSHPRS